MKPAHNVILQISYPAVPIKKRTGALYSCWLVALSDVDSTTQLLTNGEDEPNACHMAYVHHLSTHALSKNPVKFFAEAYRIPLAITWLYH